MKKIGVIDYYLDQYHFENYPTWIKEFSDGEMEIAYAWAKTEHEGGKTNAVCAAEQGVELLGSIEEVIEKSDFLIVMSPDNPEQHEELCELPLASGKLTYVDKTFATSREKAINIINMAKKGNTPFFSTSALRFSAEYENIIKEGTDIRQKYGIHHCTDSQKFSSKTNFNEKQNNVHDQLKISIGHPQLVCHCHVHSAEWIISQTRQFKNPNSHTDKNVSDTHDQHMLPVYVP